MYRRMKPNIDSDFNPTMIASNLFETIIDNIRSSNLNFQLQMSPFSAQISLKKSLVTEKTGVPRLPPPIHASNSISVKNMQLEKDLNSLKKDYARAVDDCDDAHAKIEYLEAELAKTVIKHEKDDNTVIETLQQEIEKLTIENMKLRETSRANDVEIIDLKISVKAKTDITNLLNKKLSEVKIKLEKENAANKKLLKAEIKSWRKELGDERKKNIKLEKELEKLENKHTKKENNEKSIEEVMPETVMSDSDSCETLCSLCAIVITENKGKGGNLSVWSYKTKSRKEK